MSDEAVAAKASGAFERVESQVRDWIRADRSTDFAPEAGRYHLWLAWNCTWSQRTMIARNLLGLGEAISTSMAHWHRNDEGWWFREGLDELRATDPQAWERWSADGGFEAAPDVEGLSLWKIYVAGDPNYSGRATVPLLWDRKLGRLVSNESEEILRMIEGEFSALANGRELRPPSRRAEIDEVNTWVYRDINNGVYKVGFAKSQAAYQRAVEALFAALDAVEAKLAEQRYLCGPHLSEADIRLFPTLIRFDAVYFGHFKCNVRRIADYPHLSAYLRDLYQTPGFAETVDVQYYQLGYMGRSERLNPSRIIPAGPDLGLDAPHQRARLGPGGFAQRAAS